MNENVKRLQSIPDVELSDHCYLTVVRSIFLPLFSDFLSVFKGELHIILAERSVTFFPAVELPM